MFIRLNGSIYVERMALFSWIQWLRHHGILKILKFKQLLDVGIITQEEFEAKKKQLLNL